MPDDGRAMSLVTRNSPPPTEPPAGTTLIRSPLVLGSVGAAQAAVGSLLCVLVPVLVVWIASASTGSVWTETTRVGTGAWLLAHHGSIRVDGGSLSLVPLGLTLLPLAWCWSGGRRLGHALATVGPSDLRRQALRAWGAFTVTYAVMLGLIGLVTGSSVARAVTAQAMVGGLVLAGFAGAGSISSVLVAARTDGGTAASYIADRLRVPAQARLVLRSAVVAVAAWLAAASLLTLIALLLGWERVNALREALAPGPVGAAGLVLLDAAYLPTAVLWSASWLAGPGFAVGVDTAVTPATTTLGALPAVPLLGALPEPGTTPGWMLAVVAVPVLAGVLAGVRLRRSTGGVSLPMDLVLAAGASSAAGVAATLLAWLSTGAAGSGRMATLGPSPALVGLAVAGEVLAGCLIAVLLLPRPAHRHLEPAIAQLRRLWNRLRSSSRRS
jgi:Family of unknown function (DUF6350)